MSKPAPFVVHPRDFRLFLEVAELGSFTKAAAHRGTVQSRISKQIAQLEHGCGGSLFRRTGRGVTLTELGERVQMRARAWLRDTDQLLSDIRADAAVPMGEVRLGILPSAAHPLVTRVCLRLRAGYPRIHLNIREGQGGELDAMLDTGSVDMAILFRYQKPKGPDEKLLAVAGTYLVSRPGEALTLANTIEFSRLSGLPLVLPRRPAHWRTLLDETARSKGFTLHAAVEADSLRVQKELVAETPGIYSLLGSLSIADELDSGRVQAARIINPELRRYVTLALPKQGHITPAGRIVSKLIAECASDWNREIAKPDESPAPAKTRTMG